MGVGTFIIGAMVGAGATWMWMKRKAGNMPLPGPAQLMQDAGALVNNPAGVIDNAFSDPYGYTQVSRYNPFTNQDTNSMPMHARLGVRIA